MALRIIARAAALAGPAGLASAARLSLGRRGPTRARRAFTNRLASGQVLPIGVAVFVLLASIVSLGPAQPVGAAQAADPQARIQIGGGYDAVEVAGLFGGQGAQAAATQDPSLIDDGTLWKPVAVDTTVQDGKSLLQYYVVQPGDTLTGIASHFGISMMTIWWANSLTAKDALTVGQTLVIPPVTGLVITVAAGDTLDGIAAKYNVGGDAILTANGLTDPTLIVGQTLIIPDAQGAPIPTQKPRTTSGGGGRAPAYSGGKWAWPVLGNSYISQYYHYGHYAIDIAAPYGNGIVAAIPGTIIFAGWMDNGGGYQVWISHGNNLYTNYLHMSAVLVSVGQSVAKGQLIGRIGMTGWATGPHCHFEVWIGYPWKGYRVNPLNYY